MELFFLLFVGMLFYFVFKKKRGDSSRNSPSEIYRPAPQGPMKSTNLTKTYSHLVRSDGEDDLDEFRITVGYGNAIESKNEKPGEWIQKGRVVQVGSFRINGGNFYLGGRLHAFGGYGTEASLVDDTLPIKTGIRTSGPGYWPSYDQLSAAERGTYLSWLAGGRDDPQTPVGYIFLYFYGIERRLLVDFPDGKVDEGECRKLYEEILRLREIFGESGSFRNYSTHLIEHMSILAPHLFPFDVTAIEESTWEAPLFRYRLASAVAAEEPISSSLALAWVKWYPEYSLRTPARRCGEEFGKLFCKRYTEKFGDGIKVKPNKTRLTIGYRPASPSLRGYEAPGFDLPDPVMLKAPLKKLIELAETCIDELDAYSRYLGRKGTSKEDLTGTLLLPDDLLAEMDVPRITRFKEWANGVIRDHGGLVTIKDFWLHSGESLPDSLNKKEMELMVNLARKVGVGFAPDFRYHHAKPALDGLIALFAEGHGEYFQPSRAFNEVGMVLRLGAMVATIDGHVDETEASMLKQLIDHDTQLSPVEKRSLHAYLLWRLNTPASMTGLKKRLEALEEKEKNVASRFLVGVALADGVVAPAEVKQLEKLYAALGLDKAMVSSDIHNLSASQRGLTRSESFSRDEDFGQRTNFSLDEEVLRLHESETKDVQKMLDAIFLQEEETEGKDSHPATMQPNAVTRQDGLDEQHRRLFQTLMGKSEWSRAEVQSICDAYGLLVDGAMETINDWAYELVDAPVLEEDGAIFLDHEIVEELENMKGSA